MGIPSDDLSDEVARETVCAVERDVFVVTVLRRDPGSIVAEVLSVLEERVYAASPRSRLQAVVDIRDAAFSPSGQEIRWGASRLRRLEEGGRIALLVANDFQFGLGRMFGLLSQDTGVEVRPFREPDDAAVWARGD